MFEDIEKFLGEHRGVGSIDESKGNKGKPIDSDEVSREINEMLEAKFGAKGFKVENVRIGRGGRGSSGGFENVGTFSHVLERLSEIENGFGKALIVMGEQLQLKPMCQDAKGKTLKIGDILKCSKEETKKVMVIGYGYCFLSRTDDHKVMDGIWYQDTINRYKFIL